MGTQLLITAAIIVGMIYASFYHGDPNVTPSPPSTQTHEQTRVPHKSSIPVSPLATHPLTLSCTRLHVHSIQTPTTHHKPHHQPDRPPTTHQHPHQPGSSPIHPTCATTRFPSMNRTHPLWQYRTSFGNGFINNFSLNLVLIIVMMAILCALFSKKNSYPMNCILALITSCSTRAYIVVSRHRYPLSSRMHSRPPNSHRTPPLLIWTPLNVPSSRSPPQTSCCSPLL